MRIVSVTMKPRVALAGLLIVATGCSASFQIGGVSVEDAAINLINGDLAQSVGRGPLATTCGEVADPQVGTEFECRSRTEDNEQIDWAVVVDREDHIDVQSQNVVLVSVLPELETNAVTALYGTDNPLGVAIDCGERSRILDANTMVCDAAAAAEPSVIHDATFTFSDVETGDFEVIVSEEPRS